MIFTYHGYDTYIFDLDSKGQALALKDGILIPGSLSTPNCLGILRLVDDKVVIDVTNKATRPDHDTERDFYVINDGDMVQVGNNMLHLQLNYNASGKLMGGTFTLKTVNATEKAQQDHDDSSLETTPHPKESSFEKSSQNSSSESETAWADYAEQPSPSPVPYSISDAAQADKPNNTTSDSGDIVNREKLDQLTVETFVVERTSFASSDTGASSDSKSKQKSNPESSSSSSGSSSGGEKRESLDQIAREASIIESTFLAEQNNDNVKMSQSQLQPPKEHLLKIGEGFKEDLFAGGYEYVVKHFIGKGGFGEVYQVIDKQGNPYALKVLNPDIIKGKENISALFDNEVSIGRYLEFPALVRTLESGFDVHHQLRYCIMTYIDGVNFAQIIAYMIKQENRLHYLYATWIVLKVAEVLKFLSAHGIVHRDIKTQNVMLNRQGEIKVMDLGIARQRNDNSPLKPNEPLGTLSYLPLRHLYRQDPVDARLDIYCLGVMYYRLLTNKPPIPEPPAICESRVKYYRNMTEDIYKNPSSIPDPRKIVGKIPDDVSTIVMKMMDQDINKRYANIKKLISDLNKVVNTENNTERISDELGKLCSNVVHLKPYKSPSYLPVRKMHVRRSLWIVLSIAVLLLFVSNGLKYVEKFNHNEDLFYSLVNTKQSSESIKSLESFEYDLDELETDGKGNPISWSSTQWVRWSSCKAKEHDILDFLDRYKDLSQKANDVFWFLKNFYWVVETPKIWSSDEQEKFHAIRNRMETIRMEITKQSKEITDHLKTDTENLKQMIRSLNYQNDKQKQDKSMEMITLYLEKLCFLSCAGSYSKNTYITENINDFFHVFSDFSPSRSHYFQNTWLNWCKTLWNIKFKQEQNYKETISYLDKELDKPTRYLIINNHDTYYFYEFKADFKFALKRNTILFAAETISECRNNVHSLTVNHNQQANIEAIKYWYLKAHKADKDIQQAGQYIDEHYGASTASNNKKLLSEEEFQEILRLREKVNEIFSEIEKTYQMSMALP